MASIGVSKLARLLPIARDGKLTPNIIALAKRKDIKVRELSALISTSPGAGDDGGGDDKYTPQPCISCPRCGQDIMGAKWVKGAEAPPVENVEEPVTSVG